MSFTITSLHQLLQEHYHLTCQQLVPGPRQFVAETFIATIDAQHQYFIKVIPLAEFPRKIVQSLPILQSLNSAHLPHIPAVIPTASGQLHLEHARSIIAVFTYLPGQQTHTFNQTQLGHFLAELHTLTSQITNPPPTESFTSYLDSLFVPAFDTVMLQKHDDDIVRKLQTFLTPYETQIRTDWDVLQQIIQSCRNQERHSFVITHGDAPGNILVADDGQQSVIDWDDILLAPAERDLWFLRNNQQFIGAYKQLQPDYVINETYYAYYVLWRTFDDLLGWINEILSEKSLSHREKNFQDLQHDYLSWLLPTIQQIKGGV